MPLMFIPEPDGERIRNATEDSPLDTVCVCVCVRALWNICIRSHLFMSAISHWMGCSLDEKQMSVFILFH